MASAVTGLNSSTFNAQGQRPNLVVTRSGGTPTVITQPPAGGFPANYGTFAQPIFMAAAGSSFSHILFEAQASYVLAQGDPAPPANVATSGTDYGLYDYTNGAVYQVARAPDKTVYPNGVASTVDGVSASADGGVIGFPASGSGTASGNQVFVRENSGGSSAATLPISITNPASFNATDPNDGSCVLDTNNSSYSTAPATLQGVSSDGGTVLFTSKCQLTSASHGSSNADQYSDLYLYSTTAPAAGQPVDLTPDGGDANGADVQQVLGASSDDAYIYFTAHGNLAAGATAGQLNLYLWHAGTISFLATLSTTPLSAEVTPDGRHLLLLSKDKLVTTFINNGKAEAYEFTAGGSAPTCPSCVSGVTPAGDVVLATNSMSSDGTRVVFQTSDALLPSDTNTTADVYEFDSTAGALSLLSSGATGSLGTTLLATSSDGVDVYMLTADKLVAPAMTQLAPNSSDTELDVFDARIDGVSPAAPTSSAIPPCASGTWSCQPSTAAPPLLSTPVGAAGSNVTTTTTRTFRIAASGGSVRLVVTRPAAAQLVRAARSGRLTLRLSLSKAAVVRVTATALIRRGGRVRRTRIALFVRRAKHGGRIEALLKLSPAARRALASRRALYVTIRIVATGTRARTLKLRLKR